MSSILKVDQLQDSGGNAIITSDGAGNLTAGTIPAKTIGTGAVLQVVFSQLNTQFNTNADFGSTGNATGLKASITPSSTSSKIFVTACVSPSTVGNGTNTNKIALLGLKHNTSGTLLIRHRIGADLSATNKDFFGSSILNYLHSPSSTSSQEYEVTLGRWSSTYDNSVEICDGGTQQSNITLMEIAG